MGQVVVFAVMLAFFFLMTLEGLVGVFNYGEEARSRNNPVFAVIFWYGFLGFVSLGVAVRDGSFSQLFQ